MEPRNRPAPRDDASANVSRPGRRRYETPRLVEYGSVGKLTQTGGQTTKDSGNMQRVCL